MLKVAPIMMAVCFQLLICLNLHTYASIIHSSLLVRSKQLLDAIMIYQLYIVVVILKQNGESLAIILQNNYVLILTVLLLFNHF